ncbi:MAG: DUF2723 domain-containing protein [Ignavibacteriae bacterium HGW-Ignavibacteriae-2]|nr:MAG: DUF2723 domain-containing protein [Ignavibacteriae bacterium HGW-Ignavibacteriae-2]
MNQKYLHRGIGFVVFLVSAIVFFLTVQPSVSFWDCGEFIASSNLLQVPHPPGTPFFLLLGRLLAMIPFADNIAFRVNTISVLSSAFVILFLYLIAVKLIENYKNKNHVSTLDALGTYIAAAIGALSLAFSDTFWFNAAEAEVYALSTFFIAFTTYLMVLWNEKADEPDNEKYLVMIAYLMGLSTGVHLMAVLAIVPIVMTIMFRKFITDESILKKSGIIFIIHAVIVLLIAFALWSAETGTQAPFPEDYKAFDRRFLMIVGFASLIFMGALWKKIFNRDSFYIPLLIGGIALFSIYPGFVKYVPLLILKISGNSFVFNLITVFVILAVLIGGSIWSSNKNKQTLHLTFRLLLFAFLGYSSYAMIMIRSNQETPINLNSPKTMTELYSYVNREQYGDFPMFKRRYSNESHQQDIYTSYSSDLDFFWKYQMNHMFNRYWMWNYVGRQSTIQDSGIDISKFFAIPFLIGILGAVFHFKRDWKMASVFMVMFIFLGYLTVFYQNQQEPQPRERDYFYVGAFFVFSIWIALGIRGILDVIQEQLKESSFTRPLFSGTLIAGFVAIPLLMLSKNYYEHDRSRNYVPWDYSYNMLQSVEKDAILFTNGDNDTFPLWYLQDVEGVRPDVRIANLSLLNTSWYIKQLKNNSPHGAKPIKMNMSDSQIDQLQPSQWEPKTMSLPVSKEIYKQYGITDTAAIRKNFVTWKMNHTTSFGQYKVVRVQDLAVLEMIQANNWERPIYFAVTCTDNSKIGLSDYLQMEGLAFKLVPYKRENSYFFVNEEIMRKQIFEEPSGFSKTYQPGFKFRGLNDPTIFMDENHQRLFTNYRNSFIRLALYYLEEEKDNTKALATLNLMEEKLPRNVVEIEYYILSNLAALYHKAGDNKTFLQLSSEVEQKALAMIDANPYDYKSETNPYLVLLGIYEDLGQYNKLVELLSRLRTLTGDQSLTPLINRYEKLAAKDSLEVKKRN